MVEQVLRVLIFPVLSTEEVVEQGCVHLYLVALFFMRVVVAQVTTETYLVLSPVKGAQVVAQTVELVFLVRPQVLQVIRGVVVEVSVLIIQEAVVLPVREVVEDQA